MNTEITKRQRYGIVIVEVPEGDSNRYFAKCFFYEAYQGELKRNEWAVRNGACPRILFSKSNARSVTRGLEDAQDLVSKLCEEGPSQTVISAAKGLGFNYLLAPKES